MKNTIEEARFGELYSSYLTGGGGGCSTVLLLRCTKGGLKFMTWLAPMPPSHVATSCGKGGVGVTLNTSPLQCNQENCLYIAVRVLLWHVQHPTGQWSKPPHLK